MIMLATMLTKFIHYMHCTDLDIVVLCKVCEQISTWRAKSEKLRLKMDLNMKMSLKPVSDLQEPVGIRSNRSKNVSKLVGLV